MTHSPEHQSRAPHELASPDMERIIGEAANERSILMGGLLYLTGRGLELSGDVYDKILHSVERRHLLPEGSGRIVMQRCIDEWSGHVELLRSFLGHHDSDTE